MMVIVIVIVIVKIRVIVIVIVIVIMIVIVIVIVIVSTIHPHMTVPTKAAQSSVCCTVRIALSSWVLSCADELSTIPMARPRQIVVIEHDIIL